MNNNQGTDKLELLHNYDAAPSSLITETTIIRSRARMEQILATPQIATDGQSARFRDSATAALGLAQNDVRKRRNRRVLRWAAIPVAAAAIIGISTILPQNAGTVAPAFANWTAIPTPAAEISETALASYNEACRYWIDQGLPNSVNRAERPEIPAEPTLFEARGDLIRLIYPVDENRSFWCLIETTPAPATFEQVMFVGLDPADDTEWWQLRAAHGLIRGGPHQLGSIARIDRLVTFTENPAQDVFGGWNEADRFVEISPTTVAIEFITQALPQPSELHGVVFGGTDSAEEREQRFRDVVAWMDGDSFTWIRIADGAVGSDVTGVVLHTTEGLSVTATVADGRFTAWWPVVRPDRAGTPSGIVTGVSVTLANGTTETRPVDIGQLWDPAFRWWE